MEFFKPNTNINFYRLRKIAAIFSLVLFIFSIVCFFINGLNLGLDFTGGTQIQVSYKQPTNLNVIRDQLQKAGFAKEAVQSVGDSRTVMITLDSKTLKARSKEDKTTEQDEVKTKLLTALPGARFDSQTTIGSVVSGEMTQHAFLAIFVAILATMIYIAFRFEWRLSVGAAIALIHDPILILGLFSFLHIQFDLTVLAAVLTVIGYSLHDTIVVYDRIRENFRKVRRGTTVEIVNSAINQTLSRTVISSALTFVSVFILYLFGGPSIHDFAFALVVGILVGTYSSIYVAGSAAVALGLSRKDLLTTAKEKLDDQP